MDIRKLREVFNEDCDITGPQSPHSSQGQKSGSMKLLFTQNKKMSWKNMNKIDWMYFQGDQNINFRPQGSFGPKKKKKDRSTACEGVSKNRANKGVFQVC